MTDVPMYPAQPGLAERRIALACAHSLSGDHEQAERSRNDALALLAGATRRERQRVEILSAALEGRLVHALGLAFEHLEEFHADDLVVGMLSGAVAERRDPALSAQLAVFLERVTDH